MEALRLGPGDTEGANLSEEEFMLATNRLHQVPDRIKTGVRLWYISGQLLALSCQQAPRML